MDNEAKEFVQEEMTPDETVKMPENSMEQEAIPERVPAEYSREETPEKEKDPDMEFLRRIQERRPYKTRYYLLYGNEENPPENLNISGTLEFLQKNGFGLNPLKQAREGKELANRIGTSRLKETGKYCSFCGMPLIGTEYDMLRDGRLRCPVCSRTAIRKGEIADLFTNTKSNVERYFDIRIQDGITVEMVNAKKLHKKIGRKFLSNGLGDGRFVIAAVQGKKGYELLIENGAPRMQAVREMVCVLTQIWEMQNWNRAALLAKYGPKMSEVELGMAMWAEVQYCMLLGEINYGKMLEAMTLERKDAYGKGFEKYCKAYPLVYGSVLDGDTPFMDKNRPL